MKIEWIKSRFNPALLASLLGLTVLLLATSCKSGKSLSDNYEPWPNALLWEVTGNDLDEPSYVFGTIHLIDRVSFFYPKMLKPSLNSTERIVFEIDIEDMMDLSSQMGLLTQAFMADGQTIQDLLTEDEYSELKAFFDELGLPLFFFERLKPMFLTILTSMDGDLNEMKNSTTSYEFELMALAEEYGLEILGLETMEYQIGLFDSIPYEKQADMLMESIRTQTGESDQLEKLTRIYVDENIEAMVSTISDDDQLGEYEYLLVQQRNKNWIPIMEEMMASEPTFFAVGAGHLAGKEGVLRLLKDKGYTLKPLK